MTSATRVTEIISNKIPAMVSKVFGEIRRANHCPTSTPTRLVDINARAAPRKTITGLWDSALINSVATWVLSPNSAKKIVIKVDKKTPQKFDLSGLTGVFSVDGLSVIDGRGGDDSTGDFSYLFHYLLERLEEQVLAG